jgi:hypothetical protein
MRRGQNEGKDKDMDDENDGAAVAAGTAANRLMIMLSVTGGLMVVVDGTKVGWIGVVSVIMADRSK